jgi:hypothetical protein
MKLFVYRTTQKVSKNFFYKNLLYHVLHEEFNENRVIALEFSNLIIHVHITLLFRQILYNNLRKNHSY